MYANVGVRDRKLIGTKKKIARIVDMTISPDNSVIVTTDVQGTWTVIKKDTLINGMDSYLIVQKRDENSQIYDMNFLPW